MNRVRGRRAALLTAVVSGALATGAVGAAPAADATCVSAFRIGIGTGCSSGLTSIAVAIGPAAEANSAGALFGGAFAFGANASAQTTSSLLSFATAVGTDAKATSLITFLGNAVQLGQGTSATIGALNTAIGVAGGNAAASGILNRAFQLGPGNASDAGFLSTAIGISTGAGGMQTTSSGLGVFAFNLSGDSKVVAGGGFANAVNLLSDGSTVTAAGGNFSLSKAFNIFGARNTVTAIGPLALAGSIFQSDATVAKNGLGFNINGLKVPPGAAVRAGAARTAAPAAAAPTTGNPTITRNTTR